MAHGFMLFSDLWIEREVGIFFYPLWAKNTNLSASLSVPLELVFNAS